MGSIPLPALAVKDEQQNPLDTYAKGVQLQGLLANQQQTQQMRPLQLQEAQNVLIKQQQDIEATKNALKLRDAMNEAYQNAVTQDPDTGQPRINAQAVTQHLAASGQGAAIPDVQKSLEAFDKSHAELQELQTKNQQASLDYFANMAHAVKSAGYNPIIAATFLGAMAQQPGPYQQQAQATLQHIQDNPASIKPFVDQIEAASEKQRQAGSAEITAEARMKAAEKESPEKNPTEASLAAKVAAGGEDAPAAQKALDILLKQKMASRPPAGMTTIVVPQSDGSAKIERVGPGATIPAGSMTATQFGSVNEPSTQAKSRASAADSVMTLIDSARQQLADPKVQSELGPLSGRWSELERKAGNMPPEIRKLKGTLTSIYSLAGTMHGWRALQVADEFRKSYGDITATPESLIGGLDAMQETASAVKASGGLQVKPQGSSTHMANANPQTHVFDSAAWAKANPKGDVNAAKAAAAAQGYTVK